MNDMVETTEALKPNTFFIEVSGAGLPEVDGLFVPSKAPPAKSESGTLSSAGYWNGKMAWDRADGRAARSPALSYSNTYKSWRISRLDGHLAYEITCEDELPPTDREWNVYKKGVAPAPKVVLHYYDPRQPCRGRMWSSCSEAPAPAREPCVNWRSRNSVGRIYPRAT